VICAYDERRWEDLRAAVASVQQQDGGPVEIVVVVDHNPDLLRRARQDLSGVLAIENSSDSGIWGARNSGIGVASGGVVAFLDDDAVASPDWLAELTAPYEDPLVAGVGGSIEPAWDGERPGWLPPEFDWVVGCTYRGMPTQPAEVRNLIGCNMSFRKELLEALGGFRLGLYCDETDLCIRLRRRWPAAKLVYRPEARVDHRVPPSRTSLRYFLWRCYTEGGAKARVSRLVGSATGLATERRYTMKVLPRAVKRGLGGFVSGRDRLGAAKAATIVTGLATVTTGYVIGRLKPSGSG